MIDTVQDPGFSHHRIHGGQPEGGSENSLHQASPSEWPLFCVVPSHEFRQQTRCRLARRSDEEVGQSMDLLVRIVGQALKSASRLRQFGGRKLF
jgi:hypothetical protein